jgi:hypothetical protein
MEDFQRPTDKENERTRARKEEIKELGGDFISSFIAGAIGAGTYIALDDAYQRDLAHSESSSVATAGEIMPLSDMASAQGFLDELIHEDTQKSGGMSSDEIQERIDRFLSTDTHGLSEAKKMQVLAATAIMRGGVEARVADVLLATLQNANAAK